ncbi:hypothetical protein H2200_011413 [Cladophialophora chaetospira]|uniref:Peptidase C14 caspase domain-containing protein n=1 Tax=Cladophialophora chaetospira TaxID=386627 RepID=A0AA39CD46_9EURO|nr:hypothetical protein H2200_011413 [Cladophialophora chaetospira]
MAPLIPTRSSGSPTTALPLQSPDTQLAGLNRGDSDSDPMGLHKMNTELQKHFDHRMQSLAKERGHTAVSVLMLQWKPEGEGFMDTTKEVAELRKVFEDSYHFKVYEESLHTGKRADHQVALHLAKFVHDEDVENSLLIVYYAGHGWPEGGKLYLQGYALCDLIMSITKFVSGNIPNRKEEVSRVLWEEVETSLERAAADLLVIFDCCYAGLLANDELRAAPPRKIFEYVGATTGRRTARGPGKSSFTTAMIWALRELSAEENGFKITQLLTKIRKAPDFSKTCQEPVWSPRGRNSALYMLKLRPLSSAEPEQQDSSFAEVQALEDVQPVYLQLQLVFDKSLDEEHISSLTECLKAAKKSYGLPLKGVRWKGLTNENVRPRMRDVVLEVQERLRRSHSSFTTSPDADKHQLKSEDSDEQDQRPLKRKRMDTSS